MTSDQYLNFPPRYSFFVFIIFGSMELVKFLEQATSQNFTKDLLLCKHCLLELTFYLSLCHLQLLQQGAFHSCPPQRLTQLVPCVSILFPCPSLLLLPPRISFPALEHSSSVHRCVQHLYPPTGKEYDAHLHEKSNYKHLLTP